MKIPWQGTQKSIAGGGEGRKMCFSAFLETSTVVLDFFKQGHGLDRMAGEGEEKNKALQPVTTMEGFIFFVFL